jgi:hypothetical protein
MVTWNPHHIDATEEGVATSFPSVWLEVRLRVPNRCSGDWLSCIPSEVQSLALSGRAEY